MTAEFFDIQYQIYKTGPGEYKGAYLHINNIYGL